VITKPRRQKRKVEVEDDEPLIVKIRNGIQVWSSAAAQ
jgi:hypothetical protein